ncbi:MAG: response regulator [Chitinivibrionales bacterium]|nr:response regulator [Chitinivibrionales bacterium]
MNKKALVIDDDAEYRASVKDLLAANGYTVVTAEDGRVGYEEAVAQKPDVILLDVMMEDCSAGLDTVKKLRDGAETANIPVMLITGIHKGNFLLSSYAPDEKFPNVKGVYEKPVKPEELVENLTKVAA